MTWSRRQSHTRDGRVAIALFCFVAFLAGSLILLAVYQSINP